MRACVRKNIKHTNLTANVFACALYQNIVQVCVFGTFGHICVFVRNMCLHVYIYIYISVNVCECGRYAPRVSSVGQ